MLNLFFALNVLTCFSQSDKLDYGIVFDCGSSGTRMSIYSWEKRVGTYDVTTQEFMYPESKPVELANTSEDTDPVTDYANNPQDVSELLQPLIDDAESDLTLLGVSSDRFGTFPILLGATAGVRALKEQKRIDLMQAIRDFMSGDTVPFLYNEDDIIILSGEEEGYYGWLSSNYEYERLTGEQNPTYSVDKVSGEVAEEYDTFGASDMGGQSLQITWEVKPSFDILENLNVVSLWDEGYRLYTQSFQGYGMDATEDAIATEVGLHTHVPIDHPCYLPQNETLILDVDGVDYKYTPTGNEQACIHYVNEFLNIDEDCADSEFGTDCTITGTYFPKELAFDNKFVMMSTFAYTQQNLEPLGYTQASTLSDMKSIRSDLFELDYDELRMAQPDVPDEYLRRTPLQLTYEIQLMENGFGFTDETQFIYDPDISWTYGDILYGSNALPWYYQPTYYDSAASDKLKWISFTTLIILALWA